MRSTLLVLSLGAMCATWGQAPTGQITGSVADPSGAVIVGASVTLTNPATNVKRETTTNEDGIYNLAALPPGVYNLQVEAKGFPKQAREGIELQVGQIDRVDFMLQVGNVRWIAMNAAIARNVIALLFIFLAHSLPQ